MVGREVKKYEGLGVYWHVLEGNDRFFGEECIGNKSVFVALASAVDY